MTFEPNTTADRLVFPLDVSTLGEARDWVTRLRGEVGVFKVGLELFTAVGPDAVRVVHDAGASCFLDLKLHDIPATMAGAVRAACALGVAYLTVHASAAPTALARCAEAVQASADARTTLLAVTVLTSMDAAELATLGVVDEPASQVTRLARLAVGAGVRGLVCSPDEVRALRGLLGPDVRLVVPGVRPAGAALDDQKRVATPARAVAEGADLLVVGRPIRNAADPVAAARAIARELEGVH